MVLDNRLGPTQHRRQQVYRYLCLVTKSDGLQDKLTVQPCERVDEMEGRLDSVAGLWDTVSVDRDQW